MISSRSASPVLPIAALAFAIAHLAFEYFNGGVKTHHFLARADLPGFSNWLALVILPLVAVILAVRVRSETSDRSRSLLPRTIAIPLVGSFIYGAVLAASFYFGASQVSLAAFVGLFISAVALPLYRVEYGLGFILGMTVVFGSAIPLFFSIAFGALSYLVRRAGAMLISSIRTRRQ
jgi:hypothetical protein